LNPAALAAPDSGTAQTRKRGNVESGFPDGEAGALETSVVDCGIRDALNFFAHAVLGREGDGGLGMGLIKTLKQGLAHSTLEGSLAAHKRGKLVGITAKYEAS
jgi:hypothetical protein